MMKFNAIILLPIVLVLISFWMFICVTMSLLLKTVVFDFWWVLAETLTGLLFLGSCFFLFNEVIQK